SYRAESISQFHKSLSIFEERNVQTEIPITKAEIDVIVYNNFISIKTITGRNFEGVKLIWTVDKVKAKEFLDNYSLSCDIVLVQINWNNIGRFYYIPREVQTEVFKKLGRTKYIKLPVEGTNPRGVEISTEGLMNLIEHKETLKIPINWTKENIDFKPFQRWLEFWQKD
ncbi:MAG: ThaI family type II restriction endonuclease, partial [Candidatus Altarchaeum sp.]|nr:ThaI family type II restriction endonuclease [Candidatus Altarchaeum sp.]